MANPLPIKCPKGVWTKVATNVTSGTIGRKGNQGKYTQTYRLTGEYAPTDITEGVLLFANSESEKIESPDPIDVYVLAVESKGEVRADL